MEAQAKKKGGTQRVGSQKGGGPKGRGPEEWGPEAWGPRGVGPKTRKMGGPKGWGAEGWEHRNFLLFSLSRQKVGLLVSLWGSSLGMLVVFLEDGTFKCAQKKDTRRPPERKKRKW